MTASKGSEDTWETAPLDYYSSLAKPQHKFYVIFRVPMEGLAAAKKTFASSCHFSAFTGTYIRKHMRLAAGL